MVTMGQALKKRREQAGLTQKELAEKVGIHPATISKYELGGSVPPEDTLLELNRILPAGPFGEKKAPKPEVVKEPTESEFFEVAEFMVEQIMGEVAKGNDELKQHVKNVLKADRALAKTLLDSKLADINSEANASVNRLMDALTNDLNAQVQGALDEVRRSQEAVHSQMEAFVSTQDRPRTPLFNVKELPPELRQLIDAQVDMAVEARLSEVENNIQVLDAAIGKLDEGIRKVVDQSNENTESIIKRLEALEEGNAKLKQAAKRKGRKRAYKPMTLPADDPWLKLIIDWIRENQVQAATTEQVWVEVLKGSGNMSPRDKARIAQALKDVNFSMRIEKHDGHTKRIWYLEGDPPAPVKEEPEEIDETAELITDDDVLNYAANESPPEATTAQVLASMGKTITEEACSALEKKLEGLGVGSVGTETGPNRIWLFKAAG